MALTPQQDFLIDFKLYQVPATLGLDVPPADAARILGVSDADFDARATSLAAEVDQATPGLMAEPEIARALADWKLHDGASVMTIGDSITAFRASYAELLRAMLKMSRPHTNLLNVAQSGYTSTNGLQSTFTHHLSKVPAWAFILFGANDITRTGGQQGKPLVSAGEYRDNLAAMTAAFKQYTPAQVVLLTPTPVVEHVVNAVYGQMRLYYGNADLAVYGDAMREVARTQGVPCVELFDLFGSSPDAKWYGLDGLHVNLEGHKRVLRRILSVVSD